MASDSPLRAWLALAAVLAVGVTAVALRPATRNARALAGEVPAIGAIALAARMMPLVALLPTVPPAGRAVNRVNRVARVEASPAAPPPADRSRVAVTDAEAGFAPVAVIVERQGDVLPARTLAPWAAVPMHASNDTSEPEDGRGWALRTGDAIGGGVRSGSNGVRTGFSAAGRALRRVF